MWSLKIFITSPLLHTFLVLNGTHMYYFCKHSVVCGSSFLVLHVCLKKYVGEALEYQNCFDIELWTQLGFTLHRNKSEKLLLEVVEIERKASKDSQADY